MLGEFISLLIGGAVIGLLGKLLAPDSRDNIPMWLTVICGIGGMNIGYWIYSFFGGDGSNGVDWTRWVVAVLTSALLVVLAAAALRRRQP